MKGVDRLAEHCAVRMISWGARLLYVGPVIELGPHANAVGEVTIALDGDIAFSPDCGPDNFGRPARSVFVPAGARHHMQINAERIACLFVDVSAPDTDSLRARMRPMADGFARDHEDEAGLISTLQALLDDAIPRADRKAVVADAFGLPMQSHIDSRINSVVKAIHAEPGLPHRSAALARSAGLSESGFRHAFRTATGVPLKRYRLWARLTAAMTLAIRGESLTSAAHGAGFASSAHFSSAYRNMFGMTPSGFLEVLKRAGRVPAEPRAGIAAGAPAKPSSTATF